MGAGEAQPFVAADPRQLRCLGRLNSNVRAQSGAFLQLKIDKRSHMKAFNKNLRMIAAIVVIALISGVAYEVFDYIDYWIYPVEGLARKEHEDQFLVGGLIMFALSIFFIPINSFLSRWILRKIAAYNARGFLFLSIIPFVLVIVAVWFLSGMTARPLSSHPVQILSFLPILFASPLFFLSYLRKVDF